MERRKNEKAITIIALVITIIVLLILAGISIVTLTGQNGIIRKASESKEQNLIKSYEEQLDLIWQGVKVENIDKNLTYQELLEVAKRKIEEDKNFEGAKVEIVDDIIVVTVKEGYIFHIIEGKAQWVGKEGEGEGTITAKLTASEVQNKKTVFTATVEGAKGRKLTYILYINKEEKQREETYKTTISFKEQATRFGEDLTAYVKIEYGEEHPSTSNEVIVEDNTIATKEELEKFRDNVNNNQITYKGKKILIVEDINVNANNYTINEDKTIVFNSNSEQWIPIGNTNNIFEGELEGGGHSIKGIYINDAQKEEQGFIGINGGTIKNLVVEEGSITAGYCVGGVTARNSGTLYNVTNKMQIESKKSSKGYGTIGGVCGGNTGKIESSKNYGNVIATTHKVGGICGVTTSSVIGCANLCEYVKTTGADASGYSFVGGIVGESSGESSKIEQCYNKAHIIGSKALVAGIAGQASGIIDQCYNAGIIESLGVNQGGNNTSGGIVGHTKNTISNCYNIGEIKGTNKVLGGIVGSNVKQTDTIKQEIINCYNAGIVKEVTSHYGGIIGDLGVGVSNCYYLKGTARYGIGGISATTGSDTNISRKTDSELKALETLGEAFITDKNNENNGYPILKWQEK